ncbi:hypothetical protein [Bacillus mycoides]|uniref:hypothetical protein n=1 Tax=Bacillus mycoides TaxID=1405 RepID=UPI0010BF1F90|nr:hypothetical protein [Bacillus mycoides]TKI46733.1 hypothetical protein FC700_09300 [Bacillus mycoides]
MSLYRQLSMIAMGILTVIFALFSENVFLHINMPLPENFPIYNLLLAFMGIFLIGIVTFELMSRKYSTAYSNDNTVDFKE